ncbi:hypothetical protein CC79DRAFT_1400062 [Sarocladium strictum]
MAIYHIVLFKLKPETSVEVIEQMRTAGNAMVGIVPGLRSFHLGPPLASTAHRAQDFDMGLVTILDTEEQVLGYATHPAHLVLHNIRVGICTETLAYDLEVPGL